MTFFTLLKFSFSLKIVNFSQKVRDLSAVSYLLSHKLLPVSSSDQGYPDIDHEGVFQVACHPFTRTAIAASLGVLMSGCQGPGALVTGGLDPHSMPPWELGEIQNTYEVSSLSDSGPGSLRDAILRANRSPGTDEIVFRSDNELYKQPQVIALKSSLPKIRGNLLINGYIDDMLWKASGVTLDGFESRRIITVASTAAVKIEYLTLARGKARFGGAIANYGDLVLSGVMLMENSASKSGGAIYNRGRLQLINSTLYANNARGSGGAILNRKGLADLTHVTLTQNKAKLTGGIDNSGALSIKNSIVYGNLYTDKDGVPDCRSAIESRVKSVRSVMGHTENCGTAFTELDPGLGEPGSYNGPTLSIPISTGGSAFNWGDNNLSLDEHRSPLEWDQRGNGDPRYASGIADIGAFEVQPIVNIEVDTLESQDIRGCTSAPGDCSLLGALALTNASEKHNRIRFDREIFSAPATMELKNVPLIQRHLSIDASGSGTVSLNIGKDGFATSSPDVQLELINVTVSFQ